MLSSFSMRRGGCTPPRCFFLVFEHNEEVPASSLLFSFLFQCDEGLLFPRLLFFFFFYATSGRLPACRVFSFLFDTTSGQACLLSCFFYSFRHDEGPLPHHFFFYSFFSILTRRGPCLALLIASVSLYAHTRSVHFFLKPSWVLLSNVIVI